MREIKFRAWNSDDNEMYFPDTYSISPTFKKLCPLIKCKDGNRAYKMYELMQFTGLKDKNGADIYEGDICEVCYYNHSSKTTKIIQEVIFEHGCFSLRAKNNLGLELEDSRLYVPLYYSYAPNKINIIGNIHENKDLLKPIP